MVTPAASAMSRNFTALVPSEDPVFCNRFRLCQIRLAQVSRAPAPARNSTSQAEDRHDGEKSIEELQQLERHPDREGRPTGGGGEYQKENGEIRHDQPCESGIGRKPYGLQ